MLLSNSKLLFSLVNFSLIYYCCCRHWSVRNVKNHVTNPPHQKKKKKRYNYCWNVYTMTWSCNVYASLWLPSWGRKIDILRVLYKRKLFYQKWFQVGLLYALRTLHYPRECFRLMQVLYFRSSRWIKPHLSYADVNSKKIPSEHGCSIFFRNKKKHKNENINMTFKKN